MAGGSSKREQGAAHTGFEGQFGALTFTPSEMENCKIGHGLTYVQECLWLEGLRVGCGGTSMAAERLWGQSGEIRVT